MCITPRVLKRVTIWRWVVSFTPRPLHLWRRDFGTSRYINQEWP